MVTLVAINPSGDMQTGVPYLKTLSDAYPEVDYLQITDIADIPDDKPIIFFHPRKSDNNPDWLPPEDIEDFIKSNDSIPEESYWIVNADYGSDITQEVDNKAGYLKGNARWVKIEVTKNDDFKSLHGHQAMAIAVWYRYFYTKL